MSLANKYRPTTFDDVAGQEKIVQALKKIIKDNKDGNVFLFEGKTGTGKTTLSRIYAKETNSAVIEFDAALHNSLAEIQELIDMVHRPVIGYEKTCVILDECQSWFSRRGNLAVQTLLKALENPPSFVTFILCTTEGDKIISTIKDRCRVFIFKSLALKDIIKRLMMVADKEAIEFDNKELALHEIAVHADGSMRAAISSLELVRSYNTGKIKVSDVTSILSSKYNDMLQLLIYIVDKDYEHAINIIQNVQNIDKFLNSFFVFVTDIDIYYKTKRYDLTSLPEEMKSHIKRFSDCIDDIMLLTKELMSTLFYAKDSPILRQVLIAVLLTRRYKNEYSLE